MKLFIVLLLLALAIAVCFYRPAHAQWQLADVSGHLPAIQFSLVDEQGKHIEAKDVQGEVIMLYFGFAGCSAQCPVTLSRFSQLMKRLGADEQRARLLFVTVNPANDTPEVLRRYLAAFNSPHITGLTGDEKEIAAFAKRLRAAYPIDENNLTHSNAVYIFDAHGNARLLAMPQDSDESVLHDVRQLMHAG